VGSINIFKKDSLTKAALAGATFTLYSDAAATVQVGGPVTTGADGYAKFAELAPAAYYIVETAAPKNYVLPETKAIFEAAVTAGGVVSLDIENQYNPPQDIQTGMMDWNVLLIGGLALLAGLLLVVFNRRRRMQANAK
jgi:LPXTG-motif cell wall-anchored protein